MRLLSLILSSPPHTSPPSFVASSPPSSLADGHQSSLLLATLPLIYQNSSPSANLQNDIRHLGTTSFQETLPDSRRMGSQDERDWTSRQFWLLSVCRFAEGGGSVDAMRYSPTLSERFVRERAIARGELQISLDHVLDSLYF